MDRISLFLGYGLVFRIIKVLIIVIKYRVFKDFDWEIFRNIIIVMLYLLLCKMYCNKIN